eukprot:scaffold17747_cov92-Phaeocystis_antarctica.AAC.3
MPCSRDMVGLHTLTRMGGGYSSECDFHGQAALLIKENVTGDERSQQKALRRLQHPVVGSAIVRQTLTCLEREMSCAQPTIPTGLKKHTGSESDSDEGEASVLLQPEEFSGAAVSMLPPGEGAESVFNETPMIGTTTSRVGNHTELKECRYLTSPRPSAPGKYEHSK